MSECHPELFLGAQIETNLIARKKEQPPRGTQETMPIRGLGFQVTNKLL